MQKQEYDWSSFTRRVYIKNITSEQLFKKWVTSKGLEEWFIKSCQYISPAGVRKKPEESAEVGDTYEWTFHNRSISKGTIRKVVKNKEFQFTFGKSDPNAENEVIVTVNFFDDQNGSGFDLKQEYMYESKYAKVNYYISCNMGWEFHMMNLKSTIEAEKDLRVIDGSRMHVDAPSAYPLDDYSWKEFTVREYVPTDVETAFNYWAKANKIIQWFIRKAEYTSNEGKEREGDEIIQTGDSYKWVFGSELTMNGTILEIDKNRLIRFTFGKKEPESDEYVQVKVTFKEKNGQTRITVFQNNIADSPFGQVTYNLSCVLGWSYYMTNLRSIIESGYDLRETDPKKDLETRSKTIT